MKRIWVPALAVGVLAGVSVLDVLSGWTMHGGVAALVVVLGLFLLAALLFAVAVWAGVRDRRQLRTTPRSYEEFLGRAANGVRWSSAFALGWAVLLFANCSSGVESGNSMSGAMAQPQTYFFFSAWALLPLLVALTVPAILATVAQRTLATRWSAAATWSVAVVALGAVGSSCGGFYGSFDTCGFGNGPGACAAGIASLTNTLSLSALGLFLPYLLLIHSALRHRATVATTSSGRP